MYVCNCFTLELINSCKKVSDELLAMLNALKKKEISTILCSLSHQSPTHMYMCTHTGKILEKNTVYLYSSVRQSLHAYNDSKLHITCTFIYVYWVVAIEYGLIHLCAAPHIDVYTL